jgi:DNA-binding Xre family transcriptional regulator
MKTIHIGLKFKELSSKKKLTVKEVANKMEMSEMGIYKIYNKENLSTELVNKFCKALQIGYAEFFGFDQSAGVVQNGGVNITAKKIMGNGDIGTNIGNTTNDIDYKAIVGQLESCHKENALLREMVDILKDKNKG